MRNFIVLLFLTVLSVFEGYTQKIDNLSSFRDVGNDNYLRFNYENDLFYGQDMNYTQGFSFEFVAPFLTKNPLNHLFYKPKNTEIRFGIAAEHNSFTPKRYFVPEIQFNDRPFAATLTLKSFMIATDTLKQSRFTSSFTVGTIGELALGEEIQVGIHKITNSETPFGWPNQIKNDIVLNYEVGYEKQLFRFRSLFSIHVNSKAKFGTLYTNASVGLNTSFGILNSPFSKLNKERKFNLYVYAQPLINAIGYDATFQGGVFNRNSPHTISSKDIERFTGQLNYGIVLKAKSVYFEFLGAFLTKEFKNGNTAQWGGLKIGLML